jgi:hypothetical protein
VLYLQWQGVESNQKKKPVIHVLAVNGQKNLFVLLQHGKIAFRATSWDL